MPSDTLDFWPFQCLVSLAILSQMSWQRKSELQIAGTLSYVQCFAADVCWCVLCTLFLNQCLVVQDDMVYVASEVGVLGDVLSNATNIVRKGRLGPGQMVCADLAEVQHCLIVSRLDKSMF